MSHNPRELDGYQRADTPHTLDSALNLARLAHLSRKKEETKTDFDLISDLRSKLVPDPLLVEHMAGYCDGPHVKLKMNELIDAHNRLVALMTKTTDVNHSIQVTSIVDEAPRNFIGMDIAFDTDAPRGITSIAAGPREHCSVCRHELRSNDLITNAGGRGMRHVNCAASRMNAWQNENNSSNAITYPPQLSELELLNLAHLLTLWGWYCRCVGPIPQKKGPITICSSCNKIVVPDEKD